MLSKDDKKLRLKIAITGIIAIVVLLGIIILIKGKSPNQTEVTTEVTVQLPEDVIANLPEDAIIEIDNEGVEAVVQEKPVDVQTSAAEIAVVDNTELNTELAETDTESLEIVQLFLVMSGLDSEFNPVYTKTTSLYKDVNNVLEYRYTYRADDTISKGRYSDLHIEIVKDIDDTINEVTFSLSVQDDPQVDATIKANISEALSNLFNTDLYELSTMNGPIDFTYNDEIYTITLTNTLNYVNDYNIMYYNIRNKKEANVKYADNNQITDNKIDFTDITKKVEIKLSDNSIDKVKALTELKDTSYELTNATITDSSDKISKELTYKIGGSTLSLKSTKQKEFDSYSYLIKLVTTEKTQEELKDIAKNIAKDILDADVVESYEINDEEDFIYLKNNQVTIRIMKDSLEVATANSVYDFNTFANEAVSEQIQPEVVVDPETMEVTYVYPDIETKTDEELLEEQKNTEQEVEDTENNTEE